ncbi:MAG: hypothetical protein A2X84_14745, partial [Desulfuromonadaceae bacterium GWC2_58_13]
MWFRIRAFKSARRAGRALVSVAVGLIFVAACLMCRSHPAIAADDRLTPALELKEQYNDNIFIEKKNPESDFITILVPMLTYDRGTERARFKLSGRVGIVEYAEHDGLSAIDQNYLGSLDFQKTPRLGMSLNVNYLQDHQPDRDLLVSGLIFDAIRRDRWTFGVSGSYALTERSSLEGGYSHVVEKFPGGNAADSDTHYVSGSYAYKWSPLLTQSLALNYSHTEYENARQDNVTVQLGLAKVIAERWSIDGAIGGRFTRSEYATYEPVFRPPYLEFVKRDVSADETGGVAHFNLNYRTDVTRLTTGFGYDVELASGRSGAVKQTSVTLELVRRIHRDISGFIRGGYYLNRAEAEELAENEIDEQVLRLGAGVRWDLSPDWGTSL